MTTGATTASPPIEGRPQGCPGGLGGGQQAGVERHAVEVPPGAEGVEHEVRVQQVAGAPRGAVAQAAEVVGGDERAVAEDVVDGSIESGWRTLADAERAVGPTIDDEDHGATGAARVVAAAHPAGPPPITTAS